MRPTGPSGSRHRALRTWSATSSQTALPDPFAHVGVARAIAGDVEAFREVLNEGLAVRRSHAGLGAHLLGWAAGVARAAGCDFLRLDCGADNAPLRRYHERAGFEHRGDRPMRTWSSSLYERRVDQGKWGGPGFGGRRGLCPARW